MTAWEYCGHVFPYPPEPSELNAWGAKGWILHNLERAHPGMAFDTWAIFRRPARPKTHLRRESYRRKRRNHRSA